MSEPVRVTYDVGLGRMFHAAELAPDPRDAPQGAARGETWRVARDYNRWRSREETAQHPMPGTHPVVLTDAQDWGGWRVPRAEYDRDPARIEAQARIIAAAPKLRALMQELITLVAADGATPEALRGIARRAASIELELHDMHGAEAAGAASGAEQAAPPSPAPPNLNASSLAERMAALERELKLRPPAFGSADPAPPRAERSLPPGSPAANFVRGRPK